MANRKGLGQVNNASASLLLLGDDANNRVKTVVVGRSWTCPPVRRVVRNRDTTPLAVG